MFVYCDHMNFWDYHDHKPKATDRYFLGWSFNQTLPTLTSHSEGSFFIALAGLERLKSKRLPSTVLTMLIYSRGD